MAPRFRLQEVERLAPGITRFVVEAPRIAHNAEPGQFVIVRVDPDGERIPLTICDQDPRAGTITLIVQAVGRTTGLMNEKQAGDHLADVLGPLGRPSEIDQYGRVVVVAGGVGTAIVLPVARALAEAGNIVHGIVGARDSEHLILIDEMQDACHEFTITTDDGSTGRAGQVTAPLGEMVASRWPDYVFAAGPVVMMAAVAETTRRAGIPTVASLNPIMVDGTGMCGGCRVKVGTETLFACVDGPEFDAHLVDFDLLSTRNDAYRCWEALKMSDTQVGYA
jgi:ferredoxin--NADP+ reductase